MKNDNAYEGSWRVIKGDEKGLKLASVSATDCT